LNASYAYLPLLFLLVFWLIFQRRRKNAAVAHHIHKMKKEIPFMEELAKKFIGKECLIYTITSNDTILGTIKEVGNGGILLEDRTGHPQALNLEYVTRIREYPRSKNGKKKSVVLD
jgi:ferredoxin-fold anticodon binding domain-containing protein